MLDQLSVQWLRPGEIAPESGLASSSAVPNSDSGSIEERSVGV